MGTCMTIKQRGFLLLECLTALSLSVFLGEALIQLYLAAMLCYQGVHRWLTLAEMSRTAYYFINSDIHNARLSCLETNEDFIQLVHSPPLLNGPAILKSQSDPIGSDRVIVFHCKKKFKDPHVFYIGKTKRVDKQNHPIYALYFKKEHEFSHELVSGINKFHASFIKNGEHLGLWITLHLNEQGLQRELDIVVNLKK